MASSDYRLCDVCDGKVFYDSNLNYENGISTWNTNPPFRITGEEQFNDPEILHKAGTRLDSLGDWAVICTECAKTHKTIVEPIGSAKTTKLIIEECLQITLDYKNDDHYNGWMDFRDEIRKHFGIED